MPNYFFILMVSENLKDRTKKFSLRVIRLVNSIPNKNRGYLIGNQLFRSGTSVGANYRAATRGRSPEEFISKLCITEEELDECMFWMEILIEGEYFEKSLIDPLYREANELISIIIASKKTARKNISDKKI